MQDVTEDPVYSKMLTWKMHTKTDEKCYTDYSVKPGQVPKIKARCVIEESDFAKVLMGPLIQHLAYIQKNIFEWYGSGINAKTRSIKFQRWCDQIVDYEVLCIDGSAFDSTQYAEIMEVLDKKLMRMMVDQHFSEICQYCNPDHILAFINNNVKIVEAKTKLCKMIFTIMGTVGSGEMNTSRGNTTRAAIS